MFYTGIEMENKLKYIKSAFNGKNPTYTVISRAINQMKYDMGEIVRTPKK